MYIYLYIHLCLVKYAYMHTYIFTNMRTTINIFSIKKKNLRADNTIYLHLHAYIHEYINMCICIDKRDDDDDEIYLITREADHIEKENKTPIG